MPTLRTLEEGAGKEAARCRRRLPPVSAQCLGKQKLTAPADELEKDKGRSSFGYSVAAGKAASCSPCGHK